MPDGYIDGWDIPKIVSQSKIVIGCGLVGNSSTRTTMKLRDIECMVSDACYITFPSQELSISGGEAVVDYNSVEELEGILRYAYRKFYMRPSYIIKRILKISIL